MDSREMTKLAMQALTDKKAEDRSMPFNRYHRR